MKDRFCAWGLGVLTVLILATVAGRPVLADVTTPQCVTGQSPALARNSAIAMTVDPQPSATPPADGVDPQPAWQPRGGTVAFTLHSTGTPLDGVQVAVCFGWNGGHYITSPHIWATHADTDEVTYNAEVPTGLISAPAGTARTSMDMVPVADMRIVVDGPHIAPEVDITRHVGITHPWLAAFFAIVAVALGLLVFWLIARKRGIPGRGMVLWLISTPTGGASLSQLQVMLWTFVIGAAAVYVMVLSGGLIEITDGTLILLGIAGAATLGAQLHAGQANAPATPPPVMPQVPGAVTGLSVIGATAPTEVRLAWNPPTTGGPLDRYKVQYRVTAIPPALWTTVAEMPTLPHATVLGLTPGTAYDFQVLANNAGGDSPAPVPVLQVPALPLGDPVPAGAPATVGGLRADGPSTVSSIPIAWSPAARATGYRVQYRRHDSGDTWTPLDPVGGTAARIPRLQTGVAYDIAVVATNAAGNAAPGYVLTCTTMRDPQWADLVVSGDGRGQVDVTRVQMLFFTVVTALFVTMTVINNFAIPEIPQGFLILMGISNGVYVGSKFLPGAAG